MKYPKYKSNIAIRCTNVFMKVFTNDFMTHSQPNAYIKLRNGGVVDGHFTRDCNLTEIVLVKEYIILTARITLTHIEYSLFISPPIDKNYELNNALYCDFSSKKINISRLEKYLKKDFGALVKKLSDFFTTFQELSENEQEKYISELLEPMHYTEEYVYSHEVY